MKDRKSINIQTIEAGWLRQHLVSLDVLRLDEWHSVVSGNKWFKLQYYLKEAKENGFDRVATFGGAYSNHIVATAFACREIGLQSTGIIRGEQPQMLSHTLRAAEDYGMKLTFVSRDAYKNKEAIKSLDKNAYWISEGGYGHLGADGAADILSLVDAARYTHLACAVGTGTTLAGLIKTALPHQTVLGFSALKNNMSVVEEVRQLLSDEEKQKPFSLIHDYHFGGYAKYTPGLLTYLNEVWQHHQLPLDFVYTGKAWFGLQDSVMNKEIITAGSRILFIHTGGLQGNLSLSKQALSFL